MNKDNASACTVSGHAVIESNLEETGLLPSSRKLYPIHSTRSRRKSHFFGLNDSCHFVNT
jgi:hypothetical protein